MLHKYKKKTHLFINCFCFQPQTLDPETEYSSLTGRLSTWPPLLKERAEKNLFSKRLCNSLFFQVYWQCTKCLQIYYKQHILSICSAVLQEAHNTSSVSHRETHIQITYTLHNNCIQKMPKIWKFFTPSTVTAPPQYESQQANRKHDRHNERVDEWLKLAQCEEQY